MIQVATFLVPEQQKEANEFLRTHKPEGNISFNKDTIIIFYENGEHSIAHEIADISELIAANRRGRFQFEVTIHMMEADRAELNHKKNKGKWDELTIAITETKKQLVIHDMKREFAENKVKELEARL